MKSCFVLLFALLLPVNLHAAIALDDASNYGSWTNGSNSGTGFGAWDLTTNNNNGSTIFAGYFLGDSTAGAADLNTSGQSFGIYANPGSGFATAGRSFSTPLAIGNTLSFDLGVNFDSGNKGVNITNGSQGEIFNFNVGFGASVSSANATLNPSTTASYDYGGAALIQLLLTMDSATQLSYNVSRISPQGIQGTLFDGTITGLTSSPGTMMFYNSGTDNGDAQNNLYFNNLQIVPEPEMALLLLGGLSLIALRRHRSPC